MTGHEGACFDYKFIWLDYIYVKGTLKLFKPKLLDMVWL